MDLKALRARRAVLTAALADYESGKITHFDEDERGELTRETTTERIESLKKRIDDIDRKLAEDWRA